MLPALVTIVNNHVINIEASLICILFEQAGLVGELVRRFLWCICTAVTYLGLSLGFHSWSLQEEWQKPDVYIWSHGMVSLFTLQRTGTHTLKRVEKVDGDDLFEWDSRNTRGYGAEKENNHL